MKVWSHENPEFLNFKFVFGEMGSQGNKGEMNVNHHSESETERNSSAGHDLDTASDSESGTITRQTSEASCYATEEDEELSLHLGPKWSIKEHLEKDKDDESLRRWKEQLLGGLDADDVQENEEPDVKILSLTIVSEGRPDIVLLIPTNGNPKGLWFTLKEGSRYHLRFSVKVSNDIVCGLKYTNTVWKTGIKVYSSKQMMGTFSPQSDTYTQEMPEETTPSGIFARGSYAARTKFVDDDNKCYLEINYTFDIQRDWPST